MAFVFVIYLFQFLFRRLYRGADYTAIASYICLPIYGYSFVRCVACDFKQVCAVWIIHRQLCWVGRRQKCGVWLYIEECYRCGVRAVCVIWEMTPRQVWQSTVYLETRTLFETRQRRPTTKKPTDAADDSIDWQSSWRDTVCIQEVNDLGKRIFWNLCKVCFGPTFFRILNFLTKKADLF